VKITDVSTYLGRGSAVGDLTGLPDRVELDRLFAAGGRDTLR